jgi:hypothetical protein
MWSQGKKEKETCSTHEKNEKYKMSVRKRAKFGTLEILLFIKHKNKEKM